MRGKRQRDRERISVRGLNDNHIKDVKNLFSADISASTRPGPARLLCGSGGERDAADDGASDTGRKDSHEHLNDMEERSEFRPQTFASASSLSISGEGFLSLGFSPVVFGRVLKILGSRVSIGQ